MHYQHSRETAGISLIILLVLVLVGMFAVTIRGSERIETITVESSDRAGTSRSSDARLYLEDGRIYRVRDSISYLHFRSADVWAQVRQPGTYEVRVIGWRVPIFSMFPNVIEVLEEVG